VIVERGTGSCEPAGQDLRRGEWLIDGVTLNGQRDDALRALHVDQFAGQRARTGWLQRLRGVSPSPHLSGGGEVTNRAAGLIRGDEAAQSYLMISRQTGRFIVVIDSLQPNLQPN
jgi:hypothetical protein